MKRKLSTAEKVRRMIDQGHTNKAIIEKLGVKPQAVYNIRYQINKARGLGAIGAIAPHPAEGIGAPPKRKSTRKVRAGTGITSSAVDAVNSAPLLRPKLDSAPVQPYAITMIEPPPTAWERVKERFNNLVRALRGLP